MDVPNKHKPHIWKDEVSWNVYYHGQLYSSILFCKIIEEAKSMMFSWLGDYTNVPRR